MAKLPKLVDDLADFNPGDLAVQFQKRDDLWLITDNNMATEFRKHGKPNPLVE